MSKTDMFIDKSFLGFQSSTTYNSEGKILSYSEGPVSSIRLVQQRAGSVTPNFRSKQRSGYQTNPFVFYKDQSKDLTGVLDLRVNGAGTVYVGDQLNSILGVGYGGLPYEGIDSSVLSQLQAKAVDDLLKDVLNQKVNLAVAFAERKQVADMLFSSARRIITALSSLRSGNAYNAWASFSNGPPPTSFKKKVLRIGSKRNRLQKRRSGKDPALLDKRNQKDLANAWLELQYGWKPLLSDIYGLAQHIADKEFRSVKTSSKRSATWESGKTHLCGFGNSIAGHQTSTVTVKVGCWYGTTYGARDLSQLGLTNPAAIAWEVLPYSFVVDWFLPVGNYITNLQAADGLTFIDGYMTTFERYVVNYETIKPGMSASGFRNVVSLRRGKLGSFPSAPPPTFKNPFSLGHCANAIALLRQKIK